MIEKSLTGIRGLDAVLEGGLPKGRPSLICGAAGCGKTVLAMEFLVKGASECAEPGLFVSFEEGRDQLVTNFQFHGCDISSLTEQKKIVIDKVELSRDHLVESGAYSLDPLLIRLKSGIQEIGAKRLVLDSTEALFSVLADTKELRNELARLFDWIREAGVTTIITGEQGDGGLTRNGFEEYVSDCVLLLDHRVEAQISKRRLRVVKYRGSAHGKDEYPFLIDGNGFAVFPITSTRLDYTVGDQRVHTGVEDLDSMFGDQGYFKGSTILVSGKAGTGKSSLAAAYVNAACGRGEKTLYFAFEESAGQIERNMKSIGLDLERWRKEGLLSIQAFRPSYRGLEEHLVAIMHAVEEVKPSSVVIDPITSFLNVGYNDAVKSLLTRILDHLKNRGITLMLTALTPGSGNPDETETEVSSLVDTWLALDQVREHQDHRRELHVIKSRGMQHASGSREFIISDKGLRLRSKVTSVEPPESEKGKG